MAKYPWGDNAFEMWSVFGGCFLAALILGGILIGVGPDGAVGDEFPSLKELAPNAVVMVGYVIVMFTFLGNQVSIKFTPGLSAPVMEQAMMIAGRGVNNNLEQAIPFLLVFWLHAIFVNPVSSVAMGWTMVACRYLYPIAYGWYGVFNCLIEIPQSLCYCITMYLTTAVFMKCYTDIDIHTKAADLAGGAGIFLVTIPCCLMTIACFLGLASFSASVIVNGSKFEKGEYNVLRG